MSPPPLLSVAIAYYRNPRDYPALSDPDIPLPPGVGELLASSKGALAEESIGDTAAALGATPQELLQAVRFFVKQAMFRAGGDSFRILGLTPDAPPAQVRRHYGQLISLFHPDRDIEGEGWDQLYAPLINGAYRTIKARFAEHPEADTTGVGDDEETAWADGFDGFGTPRPERRASWERDAVPPPHQPRSARHSRLRVFRSTLHPGLQLALGTVALALLGTASMYLLDARGPSTPSLVMTTTDGEQQINAAPSPELSGDKDPFTNPGSAAPDASPSSRESANAGAQPLAPRSPYDAVASDSGLSPLAESAKTDSAEPVARHSSTAPKQSPARPTSIESLSSPWANDADASMPLAARETPLAGLSPTLASERRLVELTLSFSDAVLSGQSERVRPLLSGAYQPQSNDATLTGDLSLFFAEHIVERFSYQRIEWREQAGDPVWWSARAQVSMQTRRREQDTSHAQLLDLEFDIHQQGASLHISRLERRP